MTAKAKISKITESKNPNSDKRSANEILEEFKRKPEDRTSMCAEDFLELFAPYSKLYKTSTLPEKIAKLNTWFSELDDRNIDLMIARGDVEEFDKIFIPEDEFLVACGIYLDASIVLGLPLQPMERLASRYGNLFSQMQNGRSKEFKEMQRMTEYAVASSGFFKVRIGATREYFDNGSSEWNGSKIPEKQERLKNLYKEEGLLPSRILFYHIKCYRENNKYNRGYEHVLQEAPYSCFSLCFGKKEFLLPDPKMFYDQSTNRDRLIELDWEKYGKKED